MKGNNSNYNEHDNYLYGTSLSKKRNKRSKKNKVYNRSERNKISSLKFKFIILLVAVVVSLSCILNVSLAYFVDNDSNINILKVGKIDVDIKEDFEPNSGKKNVWIVNSSESPALIRVSISGRWVNPNDLNEVLPIDNSLVSLVFAENFQDNWYYCQEDGYYYYNKVLGGKATSEMLLDSVSFSSEISTNSIYEGKEYRVEIKAEAVQATKYVDENGEEIYPYKEVWMNIKNLNDKSVSEMLDALIK